jgi:antitoxin (DNA-binding transcriptional repressor) of toxin-antitoxin stability system
MVMIRINVHEAKTHLSRYLAELGTGEARLVCKRNVPVAEIRRLPAQRAAKRSIGLASAVFQVPPSFLEPLPEEELVAWDGRGDKAAPRHVHVPLDRGRRGGAVEPRP